MASFVHNWARKAAYWNILPDELEAIMADPEAATAAAAAAAAARGSVASPPSPPPSPLPPSPPTPPPPSPQPAKAVDAAEAAAGDAGEAPPAYPPSIMDESLAAAAAAAESDAAAFVAESITTLDAAAKAAAAETAETAAAAETAEGAVRDGSQYANLEEALALTAPAAESLSGQPSSTPLSAPFDAESALGPLLLDAAVEAAKNRGPRIIAIGDVHGCVDELQLLLKRVNYQPGDVVIFLGDLVAKGPDSCGAVQMVRTLFVFCFPSLSSSDKLPLLSLAPIR
jgi:hypothetical protein